MPSRSKWFATGWYYTRSIPITTTIWAVSTQQLASLIACLLRVFVASVFSCDDHIYRLEDDTEFQYAFPWFFCDLWPAGEAWYHLERWSQRLPVMKDGMVGPEWWIQLEVSINGGYPQMDGLWWKILLKRMIWGYPYFRKPPSLACNPTLWEFKSIWIKWVYTTYCQSRYMILDCMSTWHVPISDSGCPLLSSPWICWWRVAMCCLEINQRQGEAPCPAAHTHRLIFTILGGLDESNASNPSISNFQILTVLGETWSKAVVRLRKGGLSADGSTCECKTGSNNLDQKKNWQPRLTEWIVLCTCLCY